MFNVLVRKLEYQIFNFLTTLEEPFSLYKGS